MRNSSLERSQALLKSPRVLIVSGGTGGHVFPALAIADALIDAGAMVSWLGTGGIETRVVRERNLPLYTVAFSSPKRFWHIINLFIAVCRACLIMWKVRPHVVLGMGGYASVPGGIAAKLCFIPLVIHEQNAVAGRANRLLARLARHVLTGYPNALPNGQWVGNPVRQSFLISGENNNKQECNHWRFLILGGSQGAQSLNQIVPAALALLQNKERRISVRHQCGRGNQSSVANVYKQLSLDAVVEDFIDEVGDAMRYADIVICRSGAATLAELSVIGAVALLVPYPYAAANHQAENAKFFVTRKAAMMCDDKALTPQGLADYLSEIKLETLEEMKQQIKLFARPQAAAEIASCCLGREHYAT